MKEAKTNLAVPNDKKLCLMRIGATISVAISLVLLIVLVSFQIYWNLYRFRFVKDGCAVIVDNQLAIGVEKIIRGEEANRIFLEKNADYRDIEEGNEVVLVKIKVKNIAPWNADRRYMEFELYTKKRSDNIYDVSHYTKNLINDVIISPDGEYKILDTSKVFKPGETRDGIFYFEVEKEKPLSNVEVYIFNTNNNLRAVKNISLSRNFFSTMDLFLLLTIMFFLFFWFLNHILLKKRKEKRVNNSDSLVFYRIIRSWFCFYGLISTMGFLINTINLIWVTLYFVFLVTILFFISYLLLRKYLYLFYWLKKEDLTYITTEFKKQINWDSSEMKESTFKKAIFFKNTYDVVELFNEKTKESFCFTIGAVKVKHPYSDMKKIKTSINEIFNKTELDWNEYYAHILFYNMFFIIFFIEYYSIFYMLSFLH